MGKRIFIPIFVLVVALCVGIALYSYYNTPVQVSLPKPAPRDVSLVKYNEHLIASEHRAILDYMATYNMKFQCTDKGVYFHVVSEGKGKKPQLGDKIKATYLFRFLNGTVVEQSDVPVRLNLGAGTVMLALDDALMQVKPGGKVVFVTPFERAFGVAGKEPNIPPYSPLYCEAEFMSYE